MYFTYSANYWELFTVEGFFFFFLPICTYIWKTQALPSKYPASYYYNFKAVARTGHGLFELSTLQMYNKDGNCTGKPTV